MLKTFSGAVVRRVVDRGGRVVPEHAHDWPVLSLFVMGGYLNQADPGEAFIAAPSAVLYRAGARHRNAVAAFGFEQIEIEFDPAWLGGAIPAAPVSRWIGGAAGAQARAVARLCAGDLDDGVLRRALQGVLDVAGRAPTRPAADWTAEVTRLLRDRPGLTAGDLARRVKRHPAWLGSAYQAATGEGLATAGSRFRMEHAAWLLRETDLAPAHVAADAGFCDQSHMSRTFRRLLGRLPSSVRADRLGFRDGTAAAP
jgi:AraC family transcriptional regulator